MSRRVRFNRFWKGAEDYDTADRVFIERSIVWADVENEREAERMRQTR